MKWDCRNNFFGPKVFEFQKEYRVKWGFKHSFQKRYFESQNLLLNCWCKIVFVQLWNKNASFSSEWININKWRPRSNFFKLFLGNREVLFSNLNCCFKKKLHSFQNVLSSFWSIMVYENKFVCFIVILSQIQRLGIQYNECRV